MRKVKCIVTPTAVLGQACYDNDDHDNNSQYSRGQDRRVVIVLLNLRLRHGRIIDLKN